MGWVLVHYVSGMHNYNIFSYTQRMKQYFQYLLPCCPYLLYSVLHHEYTHTANEQTTCKPVLFPDISAATVKFLLIE